MADADGLRLNIGAPVEKRGLIRITPMILEFCPDLSQRVHPDKYSSNHAKNAT
jgi:hypothetical protein